MKAKDIMTAPVATVGPETSVHEIAALLYERRISAVPVVEDGELVGIVSEADLLHRHEIGTDHAAPQAPWWQRVFGPDTSGADYIKSHARRARDIMTHAVITVAPETPAAEIATLLERHGIKRLPVLHEGRLAGIVSRSDLVHALASETRAATPAEPAAAINDEAIRAALLAELEGQPWWRSTIANVTVTRGVVELRGTIESEEERAAARIAAENIPGVRRVEDRRFSLYEVPVSV